MAHAMLLRLLGALLLGNACCALRLGFSRRASSVATQVMLLRLLAALLLGNACGALRRGFSGRASSVVMRAMFLGLLREDLFGGGEVDVIAGRRPPSPRERLRRPLPRLHQ